MKPLNEQIMCKCQRPSTVIFVDCSFGHNYKSGDDGKYNIECEEIPQLYLSFLYIYITPSCNIFFLDIP